MLHSWILCCVYLSGGSSYMLAHPTAQAHGFGYWRYDINVIRNPYGVAEAGWSRDLGRFTLELAARHESSIPAPDYGQNTVEIRLRWFPWRE